MNWREIREAVGTQIVHDNRIFLQTESRGHLSTIAIHWIIVSSSREMLKAFLIGCSSLPMRYITEMGRDKGTIDEALRDDSKVILCEKRTRVVQSVKCLFMC